MVITKVGAILLTQILIQVRTSDFMITQDTVELQWLEHGWLVYHVYFELDFESIGKNSIDADIIIFGII